MTYHRIALELGLHPVNVRKIERRAILKLRRLMSVELRECGLSNIIPMTPRRRGRPSLSLDQMTPEQLANRRHYETWKSKHAA